MSKVVPEDYYTIKRVTNIESDTEGRFVAWDEKVPDRVENEYTAAIKFLNIETGELRQFTSGTAMDTVPQFSPSGDKLAFISTRKEKAQVYLMRTDGGEAWKLTSAKTGVLGFNWSPDGSKIVYTSLVDPNEPEDEDQPETKFEEKRLKAEEEEKERKLKDPRVITDLVYREGTSYNHPDRFAHLFVVDVESKESSRISDGYYHHSIATFVSDTEVVANSKREVPRDLSTKIHLVKFSIDQPSEGQVIAVAKGTSISAPVAKNLDNCFVTTMGDGTFAGQNSKWAKLREGDLEIINEQLDRNVSGVKIIGDKVFTIVEDKGKADVRQFNTETKEFSKLFESDVSVIDFTLVGDEIYFTGTSDTIVWGVWRWNQTKGVELIDDPNAQDLSSKDLVEAEEIWFTNPEGVRYQGWFFDATKVNDGSKPGLVLSIHGGPHVMWSNGGTMMHEWQSTVHAGYSVLAVNPIGSQGYGQDFSQKIVPAKWGHDDARDLLLAVDEVIDRVDKNKLYITGGSYAGFQTANIIAKDHRFKAAVAQRGVYNFVNFGFVTDIPLWFGWEMGGTPYEKLQELWDNSPLGQAEKIETPLLIIHAENDFRVPISEAESLFTALKLQDKEVVMVRYPRDGHELSRSGEPEHVVDRINRMLDWFKTHP